MEFSNYQKAIFDYVENGQGNLVVSAVAGGSKTTCLLESIGRVPKDKKKLCLAFNKSIADTLRTKVPVGVDVKTFHALGLSVLTRDDKSRQMNDRKVNEKCKEYFTLNRINVPTKDKFRVTNNINKIIDFLRLDLNTIPTEKDINLIINENWLETTHIEIEHTIPIYKSVIEDKGQYDFVDMLFLPIYYEMKFPKYDFVFVDEVQDMSNIQRTLFLNCMVEGARFMAVGDEKQRIFSFCGADLDSYERVKNFPNTIELPLSISYRCGKNIIKHAQKIVPHIEHWDRRGEGSVIFDGSINNVKYGDVILCRICMPLAKLAGKFLGEGKKVQIKGADIGKNLITLIDKQVCFSLEDLHKKLESSLKKLEKKLQADNEYFDAKKSSQYQSMSEKIFTIRVLSEDCQTVENLKRKILNIFSDKDDSNCITLSTIHKFKGLEAENVFIVEPQLIPFPYYLDQPGALEEEKNLEYVAITRAISKLEYIQDWSAYEKREEKKAQKVLEKELGREEEHFLDLDEVH
jgi:DNA helicase-2/ATP-dependent DNA helicase PcrA